MHGYFYYDASVTPQIETPDDRTSGMNEAKANQVPSPRQAYYDHIKEALNVKVDAFMGSASTGIAVLALNIACKRLEEAQQQMRRPDGFFSAPLRRVLGE